MHAQCVGRGRHQRRHALHRFALALCAASIAALASAQTTGVRAELPATQVGDRWRFETRDRRTGIVEAQASPSVTSVNGSHVEGTVTDARFEGTATNGRFVSTRDLNPIDTPVFAFSGDAKFFAFPLEVGKKWDFKYRVFDKVKSHTSRWQLGATVAAFEKVKVPAGEFGAFRIEYRGYWNNDTTGRNGRGVITTWYAPATRSVVKREIDDTFNFTVMELMAFQLQP